MSTSALENKVLRMCDEVQRLENEYGPLVNEVEALERKWRELGEKLATSTPRAYYERVLRKLDCAGEKRLLLEALSEDSDASETEHDIGEASTGRFVTLRERAQLDPQPVEQQDDSVRTDLSALEAWSLLEKKHGSRAGIVAHVRHLEMRIAQRSAQLDDVTPARMISRVKQKLSWLGDISLLCDALCGCPSAMPVEPATNLRQLVLLEVADDNMDKVEHSAKKLAVQHRSTITTFDELSGVKRPITRSMGPEGLW
ncbi:hypothetical protein PPTG_01774 [Phytophthora nicotianae INRA-310]|uniref:Uncharacterized protein n=1 Tax=Phytophthora nicotianae (strain INRA-310) TaxID=761204 RepID=W2R8B3_PHYN3|nr:hypothetical protein PPTG_01774 [Phytophthora nicotianae INRA-310]ETN21637.1 hypothetical protein PPTG_01774 [Phytophthora nicotianae INRA-310]